MKCPQKAVQTEQIVLDVRIHRFTFSANRHKLTAWLFSSLSCSSLHKQKKRALSPCQGHRSSPTLLTLLPTNINTNGLRITRHFPPKNDVYFSVARWCSLLPVQTNDVYIYGSSLIHPGGSCTLCTWTVYHRECTDMPHSARRQEDQMEVCFWWPPVGVDIWFLLLE